jgi:hypothetical protein
MTTSLFGKIRWYIHQYADKNNGHINECYKCCVCRKFKMW